MSAPAVARRPTAVVLALLTLVAALAVVPPAHASSPVVSGTTTDRGVQIPGKAIGLRSEGSAQGTLADGRYLAYFVNNGGSGVSARFFAMDLAGHKVAEVTVPQGTEINGVAYSPSSKTVFFAANGSGNAYLYEWDGTALTKRATIAAHSVLRVAASADGVVYLATYAPSDGRLYSYAGGTVTNLGQPFAGESYVRSLAVDSTSVWISNYRSGAAKLVRHDRSSGSYTRISTPSTFTAEWSAFDMTRAGSYLFMRTVNDPRLFAYNTSTGAFASFNDQVARDRTKGETANPKPYIDGISPYGISPLIGGKYVYFQRSGAGLMRVDLTAGLKAIRVDKWFGTDNTTPWPAASVPGPVSYAWLPDVAGRSGYSLVATTIDARVYVNGPSQTAPTVYTLSARAAPATINRLGVDANGNVLSGGFNLPAGVGLHDVGTDAQSLLSGPQIEGFGRYGTSTVLGGYTGTSSSAPLYLWAGTGSPSLKRYIGNSQERPVAFAAVGSSVAVGTVPIKNTLGGALSLWNPSTNSLTVKRNIIPNHSVISLAARGSLVIGGTSNVGGTGSTPTATSGRIFSYNVSTGALKTFIPPRASSSTYSWVAAITKDPSFSDRYWAISTGYLVQFRVATDGTITLTRNLGAFPGTSSPTGKELGITFVGGVLFATVGGGLSAVNPTTGEQTVIAQKTTDGAVSGLVRSGTDRLFFARGTRLFEYRVGSASSTTTLAAPRITSPNTGGVVQPGSITFTGTGTKNSSITVTDGSRSRSTVVRDDGTWSVAPMDFASGSFRLTVTARMPELPAESSVVTMTVSSA